MSAAVGVVPTADTSRRNPESTCESGADCRRCRPSVIAGPSGGVRFIPPRGAVEVEDGRCLRHAFRGTNRYVAPDPSATTLMASLVAFPPPLSGTALYHDRRLQFRLTTTGLQRTARVVSRRTGRRSGPCKQPQCKPAAAHATDRNQGAGWVMTVSVRRVLWVCTAVGGVWSPGSGEPAKAHADAKKRRRTVASATPSKPSWPNSAWRSGKSEAVMISLSGMEEGGQGGNQ